VIGEPDDQADHIAGRVADAHHRHAAADLLLHRQGGEVNFSPARHFRTHDQRAVADIVGELGERVSICMVRDTVLHHLYDGVAASDGGQDVVRRIGGVTLRQVVREAESDLRLNQPVVIDRGVEPGG
jgi:hypothetical protein